MKIVTGSISSMFFPVYSELVSAGAFLEMPDDEKNRCVPDSFSSQYHYCPRAHIDKEEGGRLQGNFNLANCVRFARPGEIGNCRLVLDWDWKADTGGNRCMLVSTMQTQHPTEWKMDLGYALHS